MKKMKILICLGLLLSTTGCYQKTLLFQAETLSVKIGKETEKKWCRSQKPVYDKTTQGNSVGLAEQAIFLAQEKGKYEFIAEARVFTDTEGCVIVSGRKAKIKL